MMISTSKIIIFILLLSLADISTSCTSGCNDYYSRIDAQGEADSDDAESFVQADSDEQISDAKEDFAVGEVKEDSLPLECNEEPLVKEDGKIVIKTSQDLAELRGYRTIKAEVIFDWPDEEFESLDDLACLRSVDALAMLGTTVLDIHGISNIERITARDGGLAFFESGPFKIPEFNKLTEIWNISIYGLEITKVSGFNRIEKIEDITIGNGGNLISISGFNSLQEVSGEMWIVGGPSEGGDFNNLESISGFERLHSIRSLILKHLDGTRIDAFKNLETIGHLEITDSSFTAEGAFERLHTIERGFYFENNDVNNMDEFSALESVASSEVPYISISNNTELEDIGGLFNIKDAGFNKIYITNNPKLPTCQVERFIEHLRSLGWDGKAYIDGNDDQATCDP